MNDDRRDYPPETGSSARLTREIDTLESRESSRLPPPDVENSTPGTPGAAVIAVALGRLAFRTEPGFRGGGVSVRRAVTAILPQEPLLHNHDESGQAPAIRFACLAGEAEIVAIGSAIPLLERVRDQVDELRVGSDLYRVRASTLENRIEVFGPSAKHTLYETRTPWIGLNQSNHRHYCRFEPLARQRLLERVFASNLVHLAAAFGEASQPPPDVCWLDWKEVTCYHKEQRLIGFHGRFETAYQIPEWLGVGRLASKGFGRVSRVRVPGEGS